MPTQTLLKRLFYLSIIGIILFEIANVYFVMPLPGSQRMNTVGLAYFLYSWKWIFRGVFYIMLVAGVFPALRSKWILATAPLLLATVVTWYTNSKMTASSIFKVMKTKVLAVADSSKVDLSRIIIGVNIQGDVRAYPIQYVAYHHRVFDTVGGKPIMVTYCSVCRTGRVFEPVVEGIVEQFRLVGMDHFNAMFEDKATHSWWRQENGEAVAGKLKGQFLPSVPCMQMSLKDWLALYPKSRILQPDPLFANRYQHLDKYEYGTIHGGLIGTDTLSWKDKSWVIGVLDGKHAKAYDWNELKKKRIIADTFNGNRIAVWMAKNDDGFFVYKIPNSIGDPTVSKILSDNTLVHDEDYWINANGKLTWGHSGKTEQLPAINAYQEFWHSWRTFNPGTQLYHSH